MTKSDFIIGTLLLLVMCAAFIAVDYLEKLDAPIY